MSLPTSKSLSPGEDQQLPPARRRRKKRMIVPGGESERTAFLELLAHQVMPSFDFFLFSLLAGLALIAALLLDEAPFYVLVILIAPFMAPVLGLALATIIGSVNFFFQTLGGMTFGSLLIFAGGVAAGFISRSYPGSSFEQPALHSHFSLPHLLVLTAGAAATAFLLARNPKHKPVVSSVALAYELYLPLGMAGFGLSSGVPGLFPNGLIVFLVHLAWAVLTSVVVMAILGLRPLTMFGYALGSSMLLISIAAAIAISGIGTLAQYQKPTPTMTPTLTASLTPTIYLSPTPVPPTTTPTPTYTQSPTITITYTPPPPTPTPVLAVIYADEGNGAWVRSEPSFQGETIEVVLNGTQIEIFEEVDNDGRRWLHVRLPKQEIDGWILQTLVSTATPGPG
jgi:uncharacterized membrane protein